MNINELINDCFKQDIKPSINKSDASLMFKNLVLAINDKNHDLVDKYMKLLTSYFYRKQFVKKTKLIDWFGQFKSNNSVRSFLNYFYSNGHYLYASNGHMMARTPHGIQGYFDNKMNEVEEKMDHPCQNHDFFQFKNPEIFEVNRKDFEYGMGKSLAYVKPLIKQGINITFNNAYFEQILNGRNECQITVNMIDNKPCFSSCIINGAFKNAEVILMSLRTKENESEY